MSSNMSVRRLRNAYTEKFRTEMRVKGYNPYDGEDVREFKYEKRKEVRGEFAEGADELLTKLMDEDPLLKKKIEEERIHNKSVAVQWHQEIKSGERKVDPKKSRACRIGKSSKSRKTRRLMRLFF